jgi:tetratricopeptide (TPR) repeat protein
MLREAALVRLGSGDPRGAAEVAAQLVPLNPLDEGFQALLIRSLVLAGEHDSAKQQFGACVALFRKELGVEPGPDVIAATEASTEPAAALTHSGTGVARAQLDAGQAAIVAGDIELGLQRLRAAVTEAHRCGGVETQVEALIALGSSLISAVRSRDEEGASALHEAISLAVTTGQRSLIGTAYRELGFVEFLRGRYERAELLLKESIAVCGDQPAGRATALVLLGACFTDTADYRTALEHLASAVELAETLDDPKPLTRGLAFTARAHLLRNDLPAASCGQTAVGAGRGRCGIHRPHQSGRRCRIDGSHDRGSPAAGSRRAAGGGQGGERRGVGGLCNVVTGVSDLPASDHGT